ncbi:MAG TPA: hypothetical protein VMY88_09815 [Acidimicrobiales bacterium]|nr:hypothetical protein [Acidimicrobiales bacterium]
MTRNLRAVALAITVACLLAMPAGASSGSPQDVRYTYVLGDAGGPYVAGVQNQSQDTPAGSVAAGAPIWVVPSGTSFAIHIDDHVVPDGEEILVLVYSDGRWLFEGCVPIGAEQEITVLRPGAPAQISLGAVYGQGLCGPPVTAGVLTVRGLSQP